EVLEVLVQRRHGFDDQEDGDGRQHREDEIARKDDDGAEDAVLYGPVSEALTEALFGAQGAARRIGLRHRAASPFRGVRGWSMVIRRIDASKRPAAGPPAADGPCSVQEMPATTPCTLLTMLS